MSQSAVVLIPQQVARFHLQHDIKQAVAAKVADAYTAMNDRCEGNAAGGQAAIDAVAKKSCRRGALARAGRQLAEGQFVISWTVAGLRVRPGDSSAPAVADRIEKPSAAGITLIGRASPVFGSEYP